MRLAKSGYYKNKGFTTLANSPLRIGKSYERGVPTWKQDSSELFLRIKGLDGQTTYDYDLHFSAEELAIIIEAALTGSTKDASIHAHAKAIGAFIREALDEKHRRSSND